MMHVNIESVRQVIVEGETLLHGHFDLGGGRHGDRYVNKDALFVDPTRIWPLIQLLTELFPFELKKEAQAIVGPLSGGAKIAHTIASIVSNNRPLVEPVIRFAQLDPTDPAGEDYCFRPTYRRAVEGQKVILVDDVRNTGRTMICCRKAIEEAGGTVIASGLLIDNQVTIPLLGVPEFCLIKATHGNRWPARECPLCQDPDPKVRAITKF